MRLLLDTHAFIWWLANDPELSREAREAIADSDTEVLVSAATVWEIAIKQRLGKLDAPPDVERQLEAHQFTPLSITVAHALRAGLLPLRHDDPFDRMLVAQAIAEGCSIVTRDEQISGYGVPTVAA